MSSIHFLAKTTAAFSPSVVCQSGRKHFHCFVEFKHKKKINLRDGCWLDGMVNPPGREPPYRKHPNVQVVRCLKDWLRYISKESPPICNVDWDSLLEYANQLAVVGTKQFVALRNSIKEGANWDRIWELYPTVAVQYERTIKSLIAENRASGVQYPELVYDLDSFRLSAVSFVS